MLRSALSFNSKDDNVDDDRITSYFNTL